MAKQGTRLFRLIMISIPILFFVLLELVLRVVGYGHSYPLFITTPDSDNYCLLYTSPSPRDLSTSRMPSSA